MSLLYRNGVYLNMRNLWEQVKKHSVTKNKELFWPYTFWKNYCSDLKKFVNSQPSALNFKSFSQSLEQYLLTVGQNFFCNKIPVFKITNFTTHHYLWCHYWPLLLLLRSSEYPGNHFFQATKRFTRQTNWQIQIHNFNKLKF